ncbi:TPA: cation transporter [Candidatus Sumerlaeota bacterium]|nr:cation transporter [Candidatus Sumerlaeota bacterium]
MHNAHADEQKKSIARLSVASNAVLVVLKVLIGTITGSVSVLSEAIHSAIDLVAAIIALFAVHSASKPADDQHPFGHGKVENVSGVIEALLIFFAAGWIIFEAAKKLMHPHDMEKIGLGFAVMLISAAVNWFVSHKLFRVANATDSVALKADAWHLRTDVYTSAGVMGGLGLIMLGHWLFPTANLTWLDPVIAICVALLIVHAAWELTIHSGRDLLDARLPLEEEEWIVNYLQGMEFEKVSGYHHLRTRKSGSFRFIEFHLEVAPDLNVCEAHDINDAIVAQIKAQFPQSRVIIHIEPEKNKSQS